MTNILDLLNAILQSNEIDVGSMQVYDAISLVAKQDKQIRSLCKYIAEVMPMQVIVDEAKTTSFTYFVGEQAYAKVDVQFSYANATAPSSIVISFVDRWPMHAVAYHMSGADNAKVALQVDIQNNKLTITGMTECKVYIQFI